ncbi:hypothetical protein AR457_10140 [Streptomyces agglomeratus]|uniref:hypothetical protein n=1 Tax=Streptomyces agglomeratus TaxID=285458 RepID=UPI000854B629|nr:hypothetical protein [Streptomyces agglomeratus]OEJ41214.1 hypothetical protein BGK70_26515 [Streptomyces agglomeratus]OEJ44409.1 hypothetical protein AR457_10140 [Streptomyces agglomeratus]
MASRSRAYTCPGADPEGRFRPIPTPEEVERAQLFLRTLQQTKPSEKYRPPETYAEMHRQNRFPLAPFWIAYFIVFVVLSWYFGSRAGL